MKKIALFLLTILAIFCLNIFAKDLTEDEKAFLQNVKKASILIENYNDSLSPCSNNAACIKYPLHNMNLKCLYQAAKFITSERINLSKEHIEKNNASDPYYEFCSQLLQFKNTMEVLVILNRGGYFTGCYSFAEEIVKTMPCNQ